MAKRTASVVLAASVLAASAVHAVGAERVSEALPLQDQVRAMTAQPPHRFRDDNSVNPASSAEQRSNKATSASPVDEGQPARVRNLRFGAGYELRMGIGSGTRSPGARSGGQGRR